MVLNNFSFISQNESIKAEVNSHLFDVVTRLGAGLDEHDIQLFSPLLSFLDCYLSANR